MKYTIGLISVLFTLSVAVSSLAATPIKSATLRCQNDDLKKAHAYVVAELQVADGASTALIDKLTIPLSIEANNHGFGVFSKQDFRSWEGNIMPSTSFEHTVPGDEDPIKEEARFGFQEIGNQIVGYLHFRSDLDEGDVELLLTCKKVVVKQ